MAGRERLKGTWNSQRLLQLKPVHWQKVAGGNLEARWAQSRASARTEHELGQTMLVLLLVLKAYPLRDASTRRVSNVAGTPLSLTCYPRLNIIEHLPRLQ